MYPSAGRALHTLGRQVGGGARAPSAPPPGSAASGCTQDFRRGVPRSAKEANSDKPNKRATELKPCTHQPQRPSGGHHASCAHQPQLRLRQARSHPGGGGRGAGAQPPPPPRKNLSPPPRRPVPFVSRRGGGARPLSPRPYTVYLCIPRSLVMACYVANIG